MDTIVENKEGIKETKEAVVAVAKLAKFMAAQAKDGLDFKDAAALGAKIVSDEEFRKALIDGFEDASKIPAEIKDIKFEEGIEVTLAVIAELKA